MNPLPPAIYAASGWGGLIIILIVVLIKLIAFIIQKIKESNAKAQNERRLRGSNSQRQGERQAQASRASSSQSQRQYPTNAPKTELEQLLEALGKASGSTVKAPPKFNEVQAARINRQREEAEARRRAQKAKEDKARQAAQARRAQEEEFHVSEDRPHSVFTHADFSEPATAVSTVGTNQITRAQSQYVVYEPSEAREVDFVRPQAVSASRQARKVQSLSKESIASLDVKTLLRNPATLRQAILAHEILSAPLALR